MRALLVINAGSSSVKFRVYEVTGTADPAPLLRGQIEGFGRQPRLRVQGTDGATRCDRIYTTAEVPDVHAALAVAGAWLREIPGLELAAAGHRIVHGGPRYDRPVRIDAHVLRELESFVPLAPLHQPNNLAPVRALLAHSPQLPQVACFDTSFHRGHGALADHYALPEALYAEGVRRYGFHGLSFEYVAARLVEVAPEVAGKRVIVAHLGNGASLCALAAGRSVASTMGFTALDGLPMGTRCGQIDPGVLLHLMRHKGLSAAALETFLYDECGLKGLSGISNDVRTLEASSDAHAAFALDYFAWRVGLEAGALAAALGGLDAFVFTAGIGEHSAGMRARIAARLAWLGAVLDPAANAAHELLVSRAGKGLPLYVIPTDEERMIAQHTAALLDL